MRETVTLTDLLDESRSHHEAIRHVEEKLNERHDLLSIESVEATRTGFDDWSVAVTAVLEEAGDE